MLERPGCGLQAHGERAGNCQLGGGQVDNDHVLVTARRSSA